MEATCGGERRSSLRAVLLRSARILRAVLAPCVAALALATAAGLVLEPLRPGSALHVHWLGAGALHAWVATAFCASVLARPSLEARWGARARVLAAGIAGLAALLAARGAWAHAGAVAVGALSDDGSFPDACLLAASLLGAWTAVGFLEGRPAGTVVRRIANGVGVAAAGFALVLAWIAAAGAVDYGARERGDAIVVFGSKVGADGRPSGSLVDRTVTACRLWRRGAAPVLVLSGGRGGGAPVSEPEAMRAIALAEGVPAAALVLDERGATTAATVANAAALCRERGWRRVLAVSHDYHLARIRLLAGRAGLSVLTVPAGETCPGGWKVAATAREVVAWAAAWLLGPPGLRRDLDRSGACRERPLAGTPEPDQVLGPERSRGPGEVVDVGERRELEETPRIAR